MKSIKIIFFNLILILLFTEAKKSSSGSRGTSSGSSKTSGKSTSFNSGKSSSSLSGGSKSQQKSSGTSSVWGSSSNSGSKSWGSGSGSRSSFKSSSNKQATAGVLGGIAGAAIGYKLGKNSRRVPYYRTYHGRHYYYGYNNYEYQRTEYHQRQVCTFEMDESSSSDWNITDEETGTQVTELVFECQSSQSCCELECCSDLRWWHVLLAVLAICGVFGCCICCIVKYCRKKRYDLETPGNTNYTPIASIPVEKQTEPMGMYTNINQPAYPVQQPAYPVQQPAYPVQQSAPVYPVLDPYYQPQGQTMPPVYGGYPPANNAYMPPAQPGFAPNMYQPVPTNPGPYG